MLKADAAGLCPVPVASQQGRLRGPRRLRRRKSERCALDASADAVASTHKLGKQQLKLGKQQKVNARAVPLLQNTTCATVRGLWRPERRFMSASPQKRTWSTRLGAGASKDANDVRRSRRPCALLVPTRASRDHNGSWENWKEPASGEWISRSPHERSDMRG